MPTTEELYDRHAASLYGMALRLADGPCAEAAFTHALVELWGTEAKRAVPCTTTHMLQVLIAQVRKQCMHRGAMLDFDRRLALLCEELHAGVVYTRSGSSKPQHEHSTPQEGPVGREEILKPHSSTRS